MNTSSSAPGPVSLTRAGEWFLRSGIQESEGGVARYHHIQERRNARVSTEITGYSVSALLELEERTGDARYLAAATSAGRLLQRAWDSDSQAMPFEWAADGNLPAHQSFFFDNGIIARGLVRLWKRTSDQTFLDVAVRCAESMSADFVNTKDIHPILLLPSKEPLARDARWSRSSDCYQLKSALAWHDLFEITGNVLFQTDFENALRLALASHAGFLDREPDRQRRMDRLHAYGYFLEALLAVVERPEAKAALEEGIDREAWHLRDLRGEFERSDVNGQLLRVRLWAHACGAVALNESQATEEAQWAAAYQMSSDEPRLDGGYNFGRRADALSDFSNPVSTAFCLQALALWDDFRHGRALASCGTLI